MTLAGVLQVTRKHFWNGAPFLAGKRGAAGEASIHLDDEVFLGLGVQCVLDVALSHHSQVPLQKKK
jgi:hypothetical protein